MYIDFLLDGFCAGQINNAVIWCDRTFSYGWMLRAVRHWLDVLDENEVAAGSVVSLEAEFSPNAIALLLALVERGCIIVPLTPSVEAKKSEFREIAQVERIITLDDRDHVSVQPTSLVPQHRLLFKLKGSHRPGLILFSSGSTGKNKAALHDFVPLLEKFKIPRYSLRTITFLLFDHIGGINTLFYSLANRGCIVTVANRSPDVVCEAIEKYKVQLLPTSPTFINLMLLSESYKRRDLSSLELVTYGTEVMPESTLQRFHDLFPHIRLLQTYGLSEVGILRSQSRSSDSLWVKIGGEGFETRVVGGLLEVKAQSAMLGYLNAPSPFTKDGWFQTGDAVEVDGDYIRILGRKSEIINIGGEKVYPAEVESVLQLMDGVADVMVSGETNPITGQIVKAKVKLNTGETVMEFRQRMLKFCRDKLPKFRIPQKVVLANESMHGERYKKLRNETSKAGL
jgi:acyl-coenzyme A synthetase/AMP-(fatty) acid ligase